MDVIDIAVFSAKEICGAGGEVALLGMIAERVARASAFSIECVWKINISIYIAKQGASGNSDRQY